MENLKGKQLALQALSGKPTDRIPVALFTWEFNYTWKAAGLEPWQLACGGSNTWHKAQMAFLERHKPDLIMYNGAGEGEKDPTLLDEDSEKWVVRDNNTDIDYVLTKNSLSLYELKSGLKKCDSVGEINSFNDADRLIPTFKGWGDNYLNGLKRLIESVGEQTLVLPHYSPAYIVACYAFGFEKAMTAMLDNPELFTYVCERYRENEDLRMRELAEAGAQAVFFADAWASCDIISPQMFERFALPYQKSITDAARKAGLRVIFWNEGDIIPILKHEAALNIDAMAFEQPRKGFKVTVKNVREVFGPKRCLFGNLDSELLLARNDYQEIRHEVEDLIMQSGYGAPFILFTGSPLPDDIKPESVDFIIESARLFRWNLK